tara:strand:- start:45 stop:368 length:324 start_codon:yes stop_codon:yes gene_type:complete
MLQVCSHLSVYQAGKSTPFAFPRAVASGENPAQTGIGQPFNQIMAMAPAPPTGQAEQSTSQELDAMHIYLDSQHIVFRQAGSMLLASRPKRVSLRGWEVQLSNALRF